ncbi:hypothetical protein STEG23_026367 [Scotinomys teguina]
MSAVMLLTWDKRFTAACSENSHQDHRVTRNHRQRKSVYDLGIMPYMQTVSLNFVSCFLYSFVWNTAAQTFLTLFSTYQIKSMSAALKRAVDFAVLPSLGKDPPPKACTDSCPLLEKKHPKHDHKQFKTVILGRPIWVGTRKASLKLTRGKVILYPSEVFGGVKDGIVIIMILLNHDNRSSPDRVSAAVAKTLR